MRIGALLAAVVGLCATACPASAATVRNYNLGPATISDSSIFGPLPIRVQGAIGVPSGPGPHPLVLVLHGRHGTGCPIEDDIGTWPCFAREQRNDLGLRHVVKALARAGMAAVAPDLNGAFTEGWGEPNDRVRWPRIVRRTLSALSRDNTTGGARFGGIELRGRLDFARLGLFGHSLSGLRAVRFSRARPVRALFLLAPIFAPPPPPPNIPFAVALGTCDGDTGTFGRGYLDQARGSSARTAPARLLVVRGVNHNYYNRTLVRLRFDDFTAGQPGCRRRGRVGPILQQRFAARSAIDFFGVTLRGRPRPPWMRLRGPLPTRVNGLRVVARRDLAGR
jgi:dienelactone hydrolase